MCEYFNTIIHYPQHKQGVLLNYIKSNLLNFEYIRIIAILV